jgi:2-polyprenyl-3-methyl-5-hydroxy-6-metoxy-1,4-benzoquinol methylase
VQSTNLDDDLARRHESEEAFHDVKYTSNSDPAIYELYPTSRIFERMKRMTGDIRDLRVLEYGCGTGWVTAELASMGAIVDSFDISTQSIEATQDLLRKHGLDARCTLRKMVAEKLDYADQTFDVVFGFAILHHLDLEKSLPELRRVMKPGAKAFFAEPLGTNPFINAYRNRTPQFRTPDERPLHLGEFLKDAREFRSVRHEEFYLTALAPLFLGSWRPLRAMCQAALGPFMALDRLLLRAVPALGHWAWYTVLVMER